jgi:uncharacterized cupin superfamily protein
MIDAVIPAIIDFSVSSPEVAEVQPPPERVLSGNPKHTTRNFFIDETGQFFAGIWYSTSGRWRVKYSENEFCHILEGKLRIEDVLGRSWTFKSGDSFVVPAGFAGTWDVIEPTRKLYALFDSASK